MKKIFNFFMEWLCNLLAIDEKRLSTIVLITLFFCYLAAIQLIKFKVPLDEGVKNIIITCICIIGGVNVSAELIKAYENSNKNNKDL